MGRLGCRRYGGCQEAGCGNAASAARRTYAPPRLSPPLPPVSHVAQKIPCGSVILVSTEVEKVADRKVRGYGRTDEGKGGSLSGGGPRRWPLWCAGHAVLWAGQARI